MPAAPRAFLPTCAVVDDLGAISITAVVYRHDVNAPMLLLGMTLGLLTRVSRPRDEQRSPAETADHYIRPISTDFAVPVFAFLSAGGEAGWIKSGRYLLGSGSSGSDSGTRTREVPRCVRWRLAVLGLANCRRSSPGGTWRRCRCRPGSGSRCHC
ncbi:hypothetical protein EJK15_04030 [Nonomuraea basaltis]|nr:hypothetical protein EJK15_04030 [Nonomuraea basaltis]